MRPRIDHVSAQYFRSGKCEACGSTAERLRTFDGISMADCDAQYDRWMKRPLLHKRCEGRLP